MLPPRDRAAGIIVQHISNVVDRMCPRDDAKCMVWDWMYYFRIGSFLISSDDPDERSEENGDGHIYTHQSGQAALYSGIVVEVGFSRPEESPDEISGCHLRILTAKCPWLKFSLMNR